MGTKKIKLAIIIKNIDGGTGTFLNQLAKLPGTFDSEFKISVLALQKEKNTTLAEFSNVSYFSTDKIRDYYSFTFSEIITLVKELLWLKREIKKINPDVLLSIDTHCNLLSCTIKKIFFRNIKLIISTHNNISAVVQLKLSKTAEIALRLISKYLFVEADRAVCVSIGISNSFKKYFSFPNSIETIPYGINALEANNLSLKGVELQDISFFANKKKTILSIGRLEHQKDFETLIRAVSIVLKDIKNLQLLIIGDGKEGGEIERIIKKLRLKNTVFILGWRKNIYPYLKKADLFVLSSRYEGFGFVLLEAMSQGVPIIAADAPFGPAEVLNYGEYGILVPRQKIEPLAVEIKRVVSDISLKKELSKQGRRRIKEYSEGAMLSRYQKLISELL